ncbi:hypothetical protein B0A55_12029, partial [Friedmanniomyces simplex]
MRSSYAPLALLALPTATLAVSLIDFPPRVSGLPSSCQSLYTQSISACQPSDFTTKTCSLVCINALQAMTGNIKSACSDTNAVGQSVLLAFLNDNGPEAICPNAAAILASSAASASSAAPSTTAQAASSTPPASSAEPASTTEAT